MFVALSQPNAMLNKIDPLCKTSGNKKKDSLLWNDGYYIFLVTHATFSACLDAIYSQVQCD